MTKKDFRKLASQFQPGEDDELARQQDVQLADSIASLAERQRERLIRQAEQMGLRIVDGATPAGAGLALQMIPDGSFLLMGCHASSAGLEVPDDFTIEQFEQVGSLLFQLEDGIQLYIGDLLAAYERLGYGEISRIAEYYGRSYKTLSNWKYVCSSVPTSLRKEVLALYPKKPLSIGHYNLVAALPENEQRGWLTKAAQNDWSVATLQSAMKNSPLKPKASPWERAIAGLESITARGWKKLSSTQRQQIRARLQILIDKLDTMG